MTLLPIFSFAAAPDGYVVKVESATVYLDWGKSSGIQAGDQFKVYRAGEPLKHPVTGEVLGQTEVDLAAGVIEHTDKKFSTGRLVAAKSDVKAGDRTRSTSSPFPPLRPGGPAEASVAGKGEGVPKELWRSEPMGKEAVGLALGDVDGDGQKEVVVAFRDQVEVFRWNGMKLESLAVFKDHGYGNYLSVETADLEGAGHDQIFASTYLDSIKRARTVVLAYTQGALKEVGHTAGFVRTFEHADGKRELLWQDLSMSRELRVRRPAPLARDGKSYREGKAVTLARELNNDQLFGFAWGDWDGDGAEDLALLQGGERLRLFFSATKASADAPGGSGAKGAKWSSDERYGGNKADFSWEDNEMGSVYPRLLAYKAATGKMQLWVPHNIQYSPIRLARLKIYKDAEIVALAWNGLEMAPVWKLPVAGMVADFGLADVMRNGSSQLWVAAVGAGDKSLLIAYQLP